MHVRVQVVDVAAGTDLVDGVWVGQRYAVVDRVLDEVADLVGQAVDAAGDHGALLIAHAAKDVSLFGRGISHLREVFQRRGPDQDIKL